MGNELRWVWRGLMLSALASGCSEQGANAAARTDAAAATDAGSAAITDADAATGSAPDAAAATDADPAAVADGDAASTRVPHDAGSEATTVRLPAPNTDFDYQLGGAYPPPAGVGVVSRDRTDAPAAGLYNICYVNGYQVQPGEEGLWDADLVLRDAAGDPIIDPDWNEPLLDVSTADKRVRIAAVVGGWIEGCADDGFDAVEIDNLDTYSRSGGRIREDQAVAFMKLLSAAAHEHGLAIAQKNSAELLGRRAELGTDFCVAEECSRWNECGDYVAAYGDQVWMIEYRVQDFQKGCASYGPSHPIVLRDLNLVTPTQGSYVRDDC